MSSNGISGPLPKRITEIESLKDLRLHSNDLTGPLPSDMANLTNLSILTLQDNNLDGFIPSTITRISNLRTLFLNNNQFRGGIPVGLGDLSELRDLRLNNNELTGNIPASLGQLEHITRLWLHGNLLEGGIPAELIACPNLSSLFINNNPNMDGCYDTRFRLRNDQWGATNASISEGTQLVPWSDFISFGDGTCCLDSIYEDCEFGPCDFNEGELWQAEGTINYNGQHRIGDEVSITLNLSLIHISEPTRPY